MFCIIAGGKPGKVHLSNRQETGTLCRPRDEKAIAPFYGRPKQEDICQTCLALSEGWTWQEPPLSKLLGERL